MPIASDEDVLHGLPHIEGTRISVLHIYDMVIEGESDPASVADSLDIAIGDVYEALAYYYHHPEEMRHVREIQEAARENLRTRAVEPPVETSR